MAGHAGKAASAGELTGQNMDAMTRPFGLDELRRATGALAVFTKGQK